MDGIFKAWRDSVMKWILPLAIFGMGGLGLLAVSDPGLAAVHGLVGRLQGAPGRVQDWNGAAQRELERIQRALDHVAEVLEEVE